MSTVEFPRYSAAASTTRDSASPLALLRTLLAPLASLRLTVTLLALSMGLVLAGTVAQVDADVWQVVHEYFRVWIAWIPLSTFLSRSMNLSASWGTYYPGGKAIGLLLLINLAAAHSLRFHVVGRGGRLLAGLGLIILGAAITWAVVVSGANNAIESELTPQFCGLLWNGLRALIAATALTAAYVAALWWTGRDASRRGAAVRLGLCVAAPLAALAAWLYVDADVRLDASGLRILWQLAKAAAACGVLGAGCWLTFSKRAGIVLIHSGIALLMISELLTAEHAVEAQMQIAEGQTATYAEDMRTFELAMTDLSDPTKDRTTTIPAEMLKASAKSGEAIDVPGLPFRVRVVKFLPNAGVRLLQPGEKPLATAGLGQLSTVEPRAQSSGVDAQQAFNMPAAYVQLLPKEGPDASKKPLDTYLLSIVRKAERVAAKESPYALGLRFRRIAKPYSVKLLDFKFDRYAGSDTPKNFESMVHFEDKARGVDRKLSIWMNNPLRYAGDTLYQASYDKSSERVTFLQVVTNSNWMIPYVACVIVAAGMLVHFAQVLVRFLRRRREEAVRAIKSLSTASRSAKGGGVEPAPLQLEQWRRPQMWGPALVVLGMAAMTLSHARTKPPGLGEMDLAALGRLPIAVGGRVAPLDSLAQNSLRLVSGKSTYLDQRLKSRQDALRWLMDVVTQSPAATKHQVIRVENLDVLSTLGLKRRQGFLYSQDEILAKKFIYNQDEILAKKDAAGEPELMHQAGLTRDIPEKSLDLVQRKFIEAFSKVQHIQMLMLAFNVPNFGDTPEQAARIQPQIEAAIAELNRAAPRSVPPTAPDKPWTTVFESAYNLARAASEQHKAPPDDLPTLTLARLLDAYRAGNASKFNAAVADYRAAVSKYAAAEADYEARADLDRPTRKPAERLFLDRIAYEAWLNHFDPLFLCWILYLTAFLLAVLGWLGWPEFFNRSANWLLWITLALHTFGLASRIYVSGRPPVTNLYSAAVFIGWSAVLMSLIFETVYRLGLGNLIAAAIGFPTLVIAHYLSLDGDTLGVMQAVLDTNFWLATHVVCIALGNSTTFLAGGFGLLALLSGEIFGVLGADKRRQLSRMIYGTTCFAIFFSLVGTILGGLWADDSWGRFWGWDPKENGALLIVLWNAIILHARWGKMCGDRGLAALAVGGNIVTTWSLFGVNQLGAGLHSYGFTSGATIAIAAFMASQLAVLAATYLAPHFRKPLLADC